MFIFLSKDSFSDWILIVGLLFIGWIWLIYLIRLFIIIVKDEEYILVFRSIGVLKNR